MTFTIPPTATVGAVVDEDYTNVFSDNDVWFNGLLPAPGAANQIPISSSTSAAAWGFADTAQIADGAITGTVVANDAATSAKFATGAATADKILPDLALALVGVGTSAWVRKASEIPSGWSRITDLNGRMPIGAGSSFGVTFDEDTAYGSSWSHGHTISDTSSSPSDSPNTADDDDHEWPTAPFSHTHGLSGSTDTSRWEIPTRGVVWVSKD